MLETRDQYDRAVEVVRALRRKVVSGQASEFERRRLQAGEEELLCWEWAEEGQRSRGSDSKVSVPSTHRDPRAIRFNDWWERNRSRYPDALWPDAFEFWIAPMNLGDEEAFLLYLDASAEYHEREYRRMKEIAA